MDAGWLAVWPEAMTDPDELLCHLSGALGCRGLIVAGQPGVLWALVLAVDGETVGRYRSDRPPDPAEIAPTLGPLIDRYASRIRSYLINVPFCFFPGHEPFVAGDVLKLHRTVFLLVVASPAPVNS